MYYPHVAYHTRKCISRITYNYTLITTLQSRKRAPKSYQTGILSFCLLCKITYDNLDS